MVLQFNATLCRSPMFRNHSNRKPFFLAAILCGLALFPAMRSVQVMGQEKPAKKTNKLPAPERILLKTKDQVRLTCVYFASTKGKDAAPIILIHGWKGVGGEFNRLGRFLQSLGHAVIVPDLRGHGESIQRRTSDGELVTIDPERMKVAEIAGMVEFDIEAVKKYLLAEHDAGKLNVEMLTIVGAKMGAIIAANWAVQDWSWPILPTLKQGQDVKALVLISPSSAFKGLKMQPAYQDENVRSLPTLVLVGTESQRAYSESRRLHTKLKRFHVSDSKEASRENLPQTLFFVQFPTSLQGTTLLDARIKKGRFSPQEWISEFIQYSVVSHREDYTWKQRKHSSGG